MPFGQQLRDSASRDSDEAAQLAWRILQDGWKQVRSQPRLPNNILQTQVTEMDSFSDSGGWNLRLRYRSGWLCRGYEAVKEGSIIGPTPGCIRTVFTLYLSLISPLSLSRCLFIGAQVMLDCGLI